MSQDLPRRRAMLRQREEASQCCRPSEPKLVAVPARASKVPDGGDAFVAVVSELGPALVNELSGGGEELSMGVVAGVAVSAALTEQDAAGRFGWSQGRSCSCVGLAGREPAEQAGEESAEEMSS